VKDNNFIPNVPSGRELDGGTLDLASIPGVREHFAHTGDIPVLVFRAARTVRVVLSPFPGIWRMASPTDYRSLIAGRSTFAHALEVKAGDEISIVSIMSAVAASGLRIQVPAELPNDIGVLEAAEEVREADVDEDLDSIDTLTEADVDDSEADPESPADEDVEAALSDLMDSANASESVAGWEFAPYPGANPTILAGWFTVVHVGGAA